MHKIYNIISFCILYALLISCQESLEERASQEAYNFTRKYCPTPFVNYVRTDSITFNKDTRSYTYYCTFGDILDNKDIIDANRNKIENMLCIFTTTYLSIVYIISNPTRDSLYNAKAIISPYKSYHFTR